MLCPDLSCASSVAFLESAAHRPLIHCSYQHRLLLFMCGELVGQRWSALCMRWRWRGWLAELLMIVVVMQSLPSGPTTVLPQWPGTHSRLILDSAAVSSMLIMSVTVSELLSIALSSAWPSLQITQCLYDENLWASLGHLSLPLTPPRMITYIHCHNN